MLSNYILSSISSAPTSDFVYSSLGFYGRRRGGELPGAWFVRALSALEIEEAAVRQTLYRMERSGALLARREGRAKWYRPSPTTSAILEAGHARVMDPPAGEWDGEWTVVHFRFDDGRRTDRDRVRDALKVEGFAPLGPGLYVHPRDRIARVRRAIEDLGLSDHLTVFRGLRVGGCPEARFVADLWDLPGIAKRYADFLDRFGPLEKYTPDRWSPRESFGLRFAVMFEYFRISWSDPELPQSLLPTPWPGDRARIVASTLVSRWLEGAMHFGDQVMESIDGETPS